ncbi:MAG: enoyl-CoA hydratase [Gammaproteobacteria bacterium]|nr:enoyl-CoA hydratase [Gammaproteobacteria bacterium]
MNQHPKAYDTLLFSTRDQVTTITLNRPDQANGLNTQMAAELADAAQQCTDDKRVKAVILTGTGRFFCAGGDVKSMAESAERVTTTLKGLADDLHKALSIFAHMDAPLIVAVNGTAAGAGFSVAIAGDLVLAAQAANFTMAYSKIGLSPDGGSSYHLPRLVGVRKAQELMFTNRVLTAQEAFEWGLINRVVPDERLLEEAQKLAEMFASGARESNSAIKRLLLQTFTNGLETQLELEGRTIAQCAGSKDGREGVAAFNEKRKAIFE